MISESDLRDQPVSDNPFIAGLLGEKAYRDGYIIRVVFATDASDPGEYGGARWAAKGAKDAFIQAAAAWSAVANVTFNILPDHFHVLMDRSGYSWIERLQAYPRDGSSIVILGEHSLPAAVDMDGIYDDTLPEFTVESNKPGGFSFVTFLHEIGHGLGLTHPFDGPASFPGVTDEWSFGANNLNQLLYTVMTYNSTNGIIGNAGNNFGSAMTPMAFDVAAIQLIYGANLSTATGDNVYLLPDINTPSLRQQFGWICIWDAGGNDTISAEGTATATVIDLRAATLRNELGGGGWISQIGSQFGGFTIANGVVIENAIGSDGNDKITGNEAANRLDGRGGSDEILGLGGDDIISSQGGKLYGGDGADQISGGSLGGEIQGEAGDDKLFGGTGDERILGGEGADVLRGGGGRDFFYGGAGNDTIESGAQDDYLEGDEGDDSLSAGDGANRLFGGDGDDSLTAGSGRDWLDGGAGKDVLNGGAGDDVLDGGTGIDILTGGQGDDQYYFDSVDDQAIEEGNAGIDTLFTQFDFVLTANFENLTISGAATKGTGNASNNSITAYDLGATLRGLGGNDLITGSKFEDLIFGDEGNDVLIGDLGADEIHGGDGNDRLYSGLNAWDPFVGASPAYTAPFDEAANKFSGDAGDDTIYLAGNVGLFIDFTSNDSIDGGTGFDTVVVSSRTKFRGSMASIEKIKFESNNSSLSSGSLTFGYSALLSLTTAQFAEMSAPMVLAGKGALQLELQANDAFDGQVSIDGGFWQVEAGSKVLFRVLGGTGDNIITGSKAGDQLLGGNGNDTLSGLAGADAIDGGNGNDILNGGDGDDELYGNLGADEIHGSNGNDRIYGGSANWDRYGAKVLGDRQAIVQDTATNKLFGDAGDDTFVLVDKGVSPYLIVDGVSSPIQFVNTDQVDGGDGVDTLYIATNVFFRGALTSIERIEFYQIDPYSPPAPPDYHIAALLSLTRAQFAAIKTPMSLAGTGALQVELQVNEAFDVQAAFFNDTWKIEDGAHIQFRVLGGTGANRITGSTAEDQLDGGNSNDTLLGLAGDDILIGGAGDDILIGGLGRDRHSGGEGTDTVSYADAEAAVAVSLLTPQSNTGDATGDTYSNIENLTGSKFNDNLRGNSVANVIDGGAGDDILAGGAGADKLIGGDGNDTADYSRAAASVLADLTTTVGSEGDAAGDTYVDVENLAGSNFFDVLSGDSGRNRIVGNQGNDMIFGRAGADQLEGGAGDDLLNGGEGVDKFNGGADVDTVTYADAAAGVSAFLTWEAGGAGEAAGEVFVDVENLLGTGFADVLSGNALSNRLDGGAGNDWLLGQEGDDDLVGGEGNDVLNGGMGADQLDGGGGLDVAYYRDATALIYSAASVGEKPGLVEGQSYGVSVDMINGANSFGEAAGDSYVEVDNVWGSHFDDVIRGDDNGGQVYGFEGNDVLDGRGGGDFFYGGTGADVLIGGAGVDNFFYLSWNDHVNVYGTPEPYEGGDTYTDFKHGEDRIILSRYWFGFGNIPGPAAALTSDYADFVTSGGVRSARPTLLWDAAARTLSFDADGTGANAAVLLGTFQAGVTLTLDDIWTA